MIGTALPLAVAAVYALMFVLVIRLFRSATKKRRPMVMDQLNRDNRLSSHDDLRNQAENLKKYKLTFSKNEIW